jgi:hypothetical protein
MRTQLLLAPALFTSALLGISARTEDAPSADKGIEKSIKAVVALEKVGSD